MKKKAANLNSLIGPKYAWRHPYSDKRWVYGTRTRKWYLVDKSDRDFKHGITPEEMKRIGKRKAKAKYLRAVIMR